VHEITHILPLTTADIKYIGFYAVKAFFLKNIVLVNLSFPKTAFPAERLLQESLSGLG